MIIANLIKKILLIAIIEKVIKIWNIIIEVKVSNILPSYSYIKIK